MGRRQCSRAGCSNAAAASLTFAYADSTAVLGPLALRADPGSYDLCAAHSTSLSVPRGWEVIKLPLELAVEQTTDELLALADAVREAAGVDGPVVEALATTLPPTMVEVGRRGHLTLLADPGSAPSS